MGEKGVGMKSPGRHRLEMILPLLAVPVVNTTLRMRAHARNFEFSRYLKIL